MSLNETPKSEGAETFCSPANNSPSLPSDSAPTFPAEVKSLLQHLKLGSARADSVAAAPTDEFPVIPNYEIECEIGRGGMGVVYRARHSALRHTVAVKMILATAHAAAAEVARFLAEAEAVAAVKHPNVVQVYDLGSSGTRPYFVMEYVEGGNLAHKLEAGRLTPLAAAAVLEPVARGVQAAHDAGIVHRDLKPANILLAGARGEGSGVREEGSPLLSLTPDPSPLAALIPKVSDFGLAKRLTSELTRTQAVMGTPQYMAPEQAGGKAKFVGPGADVYALGVILYECLTGSVPFKSDGDTWSLIRQVLEDEPEAPRKRAGDVPRDLELICLKCLEKEPHHRYPTATALADDLKRFINHEPVSVRPIGPVTRTARWAKRRPSAAGLVALGVALLLLVPPLLVWVQWRFDQRAADTVQAQEREEAAQKIAAAAKQAEDEATRARIAAEKLAEARELFGIQIDLRNRAAERPLGWTAASRAELVRAIALAGGDASALTDLRSTAAGALLAADLFPLEPVAKGLTGSRIATDPMTGRVAVGEYKSWGGCRVVIFDPVTGVTVRTLTYTAELRLGGQDGTRALAFSPDGRRLFVGTRGSKIFRFDLDKPDNKPALMWPASSGVVSQLAVAPDGGTVYGRCGAEAPVFAWDASSGKLSRRYEADDKSPFRSFAVLPSGELIAGEGTALYRWRPDGTRVSKSLDVPVYSLAVAGTMLLVGDGPLLAVHDLDRGGATDRFADPGLRRAAHDTFISTLAVHPSAAFVATSSNSPNRAVKVWELASGRLVATVTMPGTDPVEVAWSKDGAILLVTTSGQVARWRFAPGAAQQFACVCGIPLAAASYTPDGRVAALGVLWNGRREVFFGWPGRAADIVRLTDNGGNGQSGIAVDAKGTVAATLERPGLFAWKPGAPIPPAFTERIAWCPRYAPDGALWALVDSKEVQVFDPNTKAPRANWRHSLGELVSGLASLDALAVGRTRAAVGARDGTVFLFDPATCRPTASLRGGEPVQSIALAPDDSLVVAGTQNGKLRVIRTADKTELPPVEAHPGGTTALSFNHDGTLLATGGRDRTVRLWKRTGARFEPLLTVGDLPGAVRELQFGADNRLLVLLGHEHAARAWDVNVLQAQLAELKLGW